MQPFKVSDHLATLVDPYPTAAALAWASVNGGCEGRRFLARLWLSEGIPFAFRVKPAVYEALRSWLSSELGVDPKEITLVGSARLGQSLDPKQIGKPFSNNSDLDLTIISEPLLQKMIAEFRAWKNDFECGHIQPSNNQERTFWPDNASVGESKIDRGFLDANMVPRRTPYVLSCRIGQALYLIREKLSATPEAPTVRKADLRVYGSWSDFVRQVIRSLPSTSPATGL